MVSRQRNQNMVSLQNTFNTVVEHLRRQGRQSIRGHSCLYRGPEGRKCAAGWLIPDDLYEPEMEGTLVSTGTLDSNGDERPDTLNAVSRVLRELGHDLELVRHLQSVHDAGTPDEWERRFCDLSQTFELVYTPPEQN
jgi:hypothetical protein